MSRKTAVEYYLNPLTKVGLKLLAKPFGIPGEIAASLVGDVATTKTKEIATTLDDREKQERVKEIGTWVAGRLFDFAEGEVTAGVTSEWLHATLATTLDRAAGQLTTQQIGKLAGDVPSWEVWVKGNLPDPKQHRGGDSGQQALVRCGQYAAVLLADAAVTLPSWLKATLTGLSERLTALESERHARHKEELRLREAYRQHVCTDLDKMELFGARLPLDDRTYPLSVAYVSLRLQGISDVGQDAERLLDGLKPEQRHFFIEGKAGSGKTTLLRWIAVTAASHRQPNFETWRWRTCPRPYDEDGNSRRWTEAEEQEQQGRYEKLWRFQLPVLIRFRDLPETGLPAPTQLPHWIAARPSSNHLAPEWLEKELFAGRVLLLFDGLDEVPSIRQMEIFQQLDGLIAYYGNCRIIVSSRPLSRAPGWLQEKLQKLELEDLAPQDKSRLVEYWYQAFAQKRKGHTLRVGELSPEQLLKRAEDLQDQLPLHTEASNLAKVPLLCALICAIFARDEGEPQLPEKLRDLCKATCEMLLVARSGEGGLRLPDFEPIYKNIPNKRKSEILERFAFEMVVRGCSSLKEEMATGILLKQVEELCVPEQANDLLHTYVVISGLLRFAEGGDVEFLHNTIKEFLASEYLLEIADYDTLTKDPENETCQRLALFVSDSTQRGNRVIKELLQQDTPAARLLALRCWGMLPNRNQYRETMLKIRDTFVPPKNAIVAEAISVEATEKLITCLVYKPDQDPDIAAACVQALHRIRTSDAEEALKEYAVKEERHSVLKVLCEIRNPLTIQWLRKRVENANDVFRDTEAERELRELVTTKHLVEFLSTNGSTVQVLNLSNTSVSVISGLDQCTSLQRLDLMNTSVSVISGLDQCVSLKSLDLDGTSVSVISGLDQCVSLQRLDLSNTSVSVISGLDQCASLQSLSLSNTSVSVISGLDQCTSLQRLNLNNTSVSVISGLDQCTSLRELSLMNTSVSVISGLDRCTSLAVLDLEGTSVSVMSGLDQCESLQWLDLSNTSVSVISGLDRCAALQSLSLSNTSVSVISGLDQCAVLAVLYLSNTSVSVISGLDQCVSLRELTLSNTSVSVISGLDQCVSLQSLSLSNTSVSVISGLDQCAALAVLYLMNTNVSEEETLEFEKKRGGKCRVYR